MDRIERRIELPPAPSSPGLARRFCRERLADWAADDLSELVSLLVSELVTNVVLHARTPRQLVLMPGDVLRVVVVDQDPRIPVRKDDGPVSGSGRGLVLVTELSDRHGVDRTEDGKHVWFEVSWPEGAGVPAAGIAPGRER